MKRRIEAAKCAAPYVHARLAATTPDGTVASPNILQTLNIDWGEVSDDDLAVVERFFEKLLLRSGATQPIPPIATRT
jgi:hypothetical protein